MRRRKHNPGRRAVQVARPASQRQRAGGVIGASQRSLAKLSKPVIGRMLTRPRLFKTIDRANARLVWVSGPPGAGKTTLLSTYVTARKFPALWYQLDGGDNDVAAFFYYLREALDRKSTRLNSSHTVIS